MPLEIFGRFFIPVIASSAKQSHRIINVGNPLANACGSTPGRAIRCNLFRAAQPPEKGFPLLSLLRKVRRKNCRNIPN